MLKSVHHSATPDTDDKHRPLGAEDCLSQGSLSVQGNSPEQGIWVVMSSSLLNNGIGLPQMLASWKEISTVNVLMPSIKSSYGCCSIL